VVVLKLKADDIIADANGFCEQNIMQHCLIKKTPPGGERSRGGANKGTGIL
jgi:hypothetical protein